LLYYKIIISLCYFYHILNFKMDMKRYYSNGFISLHVIIKLVYDKNPKRKEDSMNYQYVTVAGSGVLGSQIAFQTAFKGFDVNVYDINDDALEKAKERIAKLKPYYKKDLNITEDSFDEAYSRISFYSDLSKAVANADIVIESIPEVIDIKTSFYKDLGKVAPEKTIFLTNSSTLLPSQFAEVTRRPEKFLALHFANEIWKNNTAEVMKHPGTHEDIFNEVIKFAEAIGMVPLPLYKEQPGY